MSEELFIRCPYCPHELSSYPATTITPSTAVRWHEQMARHIRREHVGKRPELRR